VYLFREWRDEGVLVAKYRNSENMETVLLRHLLLEQSLQQPDKLANCQPIEVPLPQRQDSRFSRRLRRAETEKEQGVDFQEPQL
jgi:hypothetical protein